MSSKRKRVVSSVGGKRKLGKAYKCRKNGKNLQRWKIYVRQMTSKDRNQSRNVIENCSTTSKSRKSWTRFKSECTNGFYKSAIKEQSSIWIGIMLLVDDDATAKSPFYSCSGLQIFVPVSSRRIILYFIPLLSKRKETCASSYEYSFCGLFLKLNMISK